MCCFLRLVFLFAYTITVIRCTEGHVIVNVCILHFSIRWPNQGCCKYQDSVMYERQLAKKLANQGLLKRKVPPPACSLLDIFQGEYKPFLGTHNKQFPTAILFWTPWLVLHVYVHLFLGIHCLGDSKNLSKGDNS